MENRFRLRWPKIAFIGLRQDRLRSSAEVEVITSGWLDEFLIMVRVPGSFYCEISAGVDVGTEISRVTGLRFSLALAESLVRNCTP